MIKFVTDLAHGWMKDYDPLAVYEDILILNRDSVWKDGKVPEWASNLAEQTNSPSPTLAMMHIAIPWLMDQLLMNTTDNDEAYLMFDMLDVNKRVESG